ncbi:serine/threonine protein kinase [Nannocystis bainbridge]|uniref:Protein kinase domain-containing protein n=1 Tax=Nannocystis bainbridge TaxID=2995303 RepID=A0ABT5DUN3_9BACT|nr:hypothetical protein [Nannocystis bainbridge]MDC0716433.1 hypothetical protein [Nannocystis bainbridge]
MSGSFSPRVGDRVRERFELMAPLREGGSTQVFLAVDHQVGREVELLLFDPTCVRAESWSAFARAVRAAAAAKIPGLVLPRGLTEAAPAPPYCATDVQAASSLARLVERGPTPWQRALTLCERIAAIVERAHAATGVAHRALTPSRCVVTGRDEVRVLDYGVVEVTGVEDSPYRAPEQQGDSGDPRSDVRAIGVMLCELITGQRVGDEPPRVDAIADLSQGVRDLVHKALGADPGQRYADLAALRVAMCALLEIEFVAVQPAPPPASREPKPAPRAEPSPAGAEPPLHGGATASSQRDVRRDTAPPQSRRTAPQSVVPSALPPPQSRRTAPQSVVPSALPPRSAKPSPAAPPPLLPPLEDGTQVLALDSIAQAPAARTSRTGAQVPVPASDGTQVLALDSLAPASPTARTQRTGAQVPVSAASDGTQVLALDSLTPASPAARTHETGAQVPIPVSDRTEVVSLEAIAQAAQAARARKTGAQASVPPASARSGATSRRAVNGSPAASTRPGTGSQRAIARPEPPVDATVVARSPLNPSLSRLPAPASAAANGVTRQPANRSTPSPAMATFVGARPASDSTMILPAPELPVRASEPDRTVIWRPPGASEDDAATSRGSSEVAPELPSHEQTRILAPGPVPPKSPRLAAAAGWSLQKKLLVVNVALAVVILVGVIVAT